MRIRTRSPFALAFVLGAISASPVSAEIPDELITSPLAELYGAPPTISRPKLSPDGSKLLFLGQDPIGISMAQVADFTGGALTVVGVGTEQGYDIGWCDWANETRVLCDQVFAVNADGTDLVQIDRGRLRRPPERRSGCGVASEARASQRMLDWMPEEPDYVSSTCGQSTRLNIYTGFFDTLGVGTGRDLRGSLMSDGHGFGKLQRHRDMQGPFDRWYFRDNAESDWVLINEINPVRFEDPFRPVGFGQNVNALFHLEADSGRWGLYGLDLGNEVLESQFMYSHPLFDLELVDTMGAYDRVVAAAYLDGRPQRFVVDANVAAAYEVAFEAFPDQNLEIVEENWDGSVYLLLAREDRRAGEYYLIDMRQGTLLPVGPEYAHLADVELAETRTVSFAAADGGTLAGHLTLPNDRSGTVPTVIIPRAMPSRLDLADPHYLVQFLAASGYAVLRLNYRGDSEYGAWLPERAVLGGKQAAADIKDAMGYLVAEGIAEPDRICGVARDLGVYAMLMNAIEYPSELACLVSIGGMADPRAMAGTSILNTLAGDYIALVRDGSPIRRAKDVKSPVLLFHGAYDGVVPMAVHTLELNQALKGAEYIEYEYGRHDLERSPYRIDMLTRIGNFLGANIGPGASN